MDTTIARLILAAKDKKQDAIRKAQREYRATVQELRALRRRLKIENRGKYTRQKLYDRVIDGGDDSLFGWTVADAAMYVLVEAGRPMTVTEVVLEIQRRGCRSRDESRAVARAVRASFEYHTERVKKDWKGRWGVRADEK